MDICAISLICCNEQLLPFKAALFRLLCNCSRLDATVIPPYMEANIQQGIIDTPQLHGSTTRVAQWGDVLTNLQQRFNGLSAGLGQYGFKFKRPFQLSGYEKRI